ncbi:MAG: efflux RND transporter periplasmic adaptor subunit [candidate division Zixibacteria bacterium]
MSTGGKILTFVIIVAAGIISLVVLIGLKEDPPKRSSSPRVKIVESVVIETGTVPATITAFGRVSSSQPVQLFSEATGTIMEGGTPFQPAQSFKRGDLLLKIDDRQAWLDLNSTKSDLLTALASLLPEIKVDFPDEFKVWQDYFNFCEFDKSLGDLPETTNQKIKLFLSRFNVYKLYFAVRDLEIRLEKHYIRAPFDGSITRADLRIGSTVRAGSSLGEIINLENLEVEVTVGIQDLTQIDKKATIKFTSSEIEGEWTGKILRIGSAIDSRTQTVPVYISINNGDNAAILNGAFLRADIPGIQFDNAVLVPRKALYNEKYVYLVNSGKLDLREVSIIRKETNEVIINQGLTTGDTMVVEVLQGVAPGMPAEAKLISNDLLE